MLAKEASELSVFFACEKQDTVLVAEHVHVFYKDLLLKWICFYSREVQLDGCHQLCAWRKDTKPSSSESQGAYILGTCSWAIVWLIFEVSIPTCTWENFLWLFFTYNSFQYLCCLVPTCLHSSSHVINFSASLYSVCLLYVGSNPWCSHWSACGLPSEGDCSVWRGGWIWDIVPANVSCYLYWWLFLSNGIDNVVLTLLQNYWCWKWVQDK